MYYTGDSYPVLDMEHASSSKFGDSRIGLSIALVAMVVPAVALLATCLYLVVGALTPSDDEEEEERLLQVYEISI